MPVVRISDELFREIQKYAEPLVDNFETALWKALKANNENKKTINKQNKVSKTTPQKLLWKPILLVLIEKGGKAESINIINGVKEKMKHQLNEADFRTNSDGTLKIDKAIHFQRLAMIHEGLLKDDSRRGIWEISEIGKQWISSQV